MCVQLFATPWTVAHQAPLFSTISRHLLKFMSVESVMLLIYNHLLYHPFLLLPSVFPRIGVFLMGRLFTPGSQSIVASATVLAMNSGLISLKIDWLDLLAVHSILKSLLQHQNSKRSKKHSACFMVQLLHECWKHTHTHTHTHTQLCLHKCQSDISTF